MKRRCRWKGTCLGLIIALTVTLPLPSAQQQQGGRGSYGAQSIVPGGFQPFPQQFYAPRNSNAPHHTATSVQNTQFGFYPPTAAAQTEAASPSKEGGPFAAPTFIQFPSKNPPTRDLHYEYYDDPNATGEEEVVYHYDDKVHPHPQQHIRPSNLPPQSFTTAQLSSRSKPKKNTPTSSTSSSSSHKFIPLVEEPEQLLLLNGRSVHPSSNRVNNIRPPLGLIRSTTTSTTTPTSSTTLRTINTRNRSTGTVPASLLRGNRFALTSSPSTTPKHVGGGGAAAKDKYKVNSSSSSAESEDYTIEYIEYPGEEYTVSEENKTQTTPPKVSTSMSKSSSSSSTTKGGTAATTTPTPKVVVSVSSSKTVVGAKPTPTPTSKVTTTTPTTTTTSSTTTRPSTTSTTTPTTTTSTTTSTAPPPSSSTEGPKDSMPSGAETSPEYYEEEYSYQQEQQQQQQKGGKGEEERLTHPQGRKLPSKQEQESNPHFHTFGEDLDNDDKIPLVGHNRNEQEEAPPPPKSKFRPNPPERGPQVFGKIKFAEISSDLLPPGFKFPLPSTTTSTTTSTTSKPPPNEGPINFDEIPSFLLPKGYKTMSTPAPSTTTTTTTTTKSPIDFDSIPLSLLPKGYKPPAPAPAETTTPPETSTEPPPLKDPLEALLSKVKFQEIAIPSLVPKDYQEKVPTLMNLLPPGYKAPVEEAPLPPGLLPPGYKPPATFVTTPPPIAKKPLGPVFPTRPPGSGVVFPTKPGGHRVTRPTSTEAPKGDTPPPPRVAIAGGWPIRKTTPFTGWPTQSTTPMPSTSSTSTEPTTTTTEGVTTTTTPKTTTTPPPPKRSALGLCPQEVCRMEATIRITGGVKWKPEFADINTEEYKHLETTVRRELDGAYRASGLAPWYKRVQIEGFNEGSVLVDYFVELEGVDRELSTADVVKVFHKSLLDSDPGEELPQETEAPAALRFGRYNIDPRYTDFKVVKGASGKGASPPDGLLPQWAVAVIIIVLVSSLFLIIVGVIVIVSRYKNSKKKNTVSLTQEMLNEFNKSHMGMAGLGGTGSGGGGGVGGVENFGADDLYNMDDVWNDKQLDRTFDRRPTKRSQSSSKGGGGGGPGTPGYNIYDSWKTEWNGYYNNGNYYGDSGYTPSRRRSDYDTNF